MPDGATLAQQYVARLRSKSEPEQIQAGIDLNAFISGELRESPQENVKEFLKKFDSAIFEMVGDPDPGIRRGGIFAIVCLMKVEDTLGAGGTRLTRFGNYLRSLLPCSDMGVTELAAKAIGQYALVYGAQTSEYCEFELKRAIEWLQSSEKSDTRRHTAVRRRSVL